MGTWGVSLYANDTVSDVRDWWLKKLKQGASGEEATAELLAELKGTESEPLFWLALADTQWTWGRLEVRVRDEAQRVLAAGADLHLWAGNDQRTTRARVFEKLAARLGSPAPPPRPVRVIGDAVDWKRGQLWAYATLDGKRVVFRVAGVDANVGRTLSPIVELLDVVLDGSPPSSAILKHARLRPPRASYISDRRFDALPAEYRASPMFMPKVKARGDLPHHRLKRLRTQGAPRPADPATTPFIGVAWDLAMDEFLPNAFDVGGPRLGAVHAWHVPNGDTAYTVIERMDWPPTLPSTQWQLGILDCRGSDVGPRKIESARTLRSIVVMGFPPQGALREIGCRPPQDVPAVHGTIHEWRDVADEIERQGIT